MTTPKSLQGKTCAICKAPAYSQISEAIAPDDLHPHRRNIHSFLCQEHFEMIFYPEKEQSIKEKENLISQYLERGPILKSIEKYAATAIELREIGQKELQVESSQWEQWEVLVRTDERQRAIRIAQEFYQRLSREYEQKKGTGDDLTFVKKELADLARVMYLSIAGRTALSDALNYSVEDLLRRTVSGESKPLEDEVSLRK
jgi:hypothetical protein